MTAVLLLAHNFTKKKIPHADLHLASFSLSLSLPQLNKEKEQRRAWNIHSAQRQVFDESSSEFSELTGLKNKLEGLCQEPSRTGREAIEDKKSRRRHLRELRDSIKTTLANVDKKLEDPDEAPPDPVIESAIASAKERLKMPPHLRGSAVVNCMLSGGD